MRRLVPVRCDVRCEAVAAMTELPERFASKVEHDPETGCWNWTAHVGSDGYGRVQLSRLTESGNRSPDRAHRVVYELLVGPIPTGLQIDHLCRNRRCVNPEHMEPVTNKENARRGKAQITHCPHGHEYTAETTVRRRHGWRECRVCKRERDRRAYWRKAAA